MPYNGHSREIFDRVPVKYVLPKGAFLCNNIATFVQKVGFNWLKKVAFYFSYSGHKCNCWLKVVTHWDKRDNGVMCTRKQIKSGLELIRMETDVATHTCKLLSRKPWTLGYQYCSFVNFCKIKVCPKKWAYFTLKEILKLGWLKTVAGTNIGPQNIMYLSAPGAEYNNKVSLVQHIIIGPVHLILGITSP